MDTSTSPSAIERRQLSRDARDAFPPMGVYAIRERTSGRVRVGASRNVTAFLNRMQFELRRGAHADRELQAAWNRDAAGLSFDVVELVKQRTDPAFDYAEELRLLEEIHREALCTGEAP